MDVLAVLIALVVMVAGLIGVIVPVVPGLPLVWAGAVGSLLWQGTDAVGWALAAVLTVLLAIGTAATVYLPTRSGRQGGVPGRTLGWTLLGAVVGVVVVPVVGLLLGAAVGLHLGERARLGDHARAWASTRRVVRAYGLGVLVELGLGVTMILLWGLAALVHA